MKIRPAIEADLEPLATIWHQGWCEVNARRLPERLVRSFTLELCRQRLQNALPRVRVACGDNTGPLGFCVVKENEISHLYVAKDARKKGAAASLMVDAEARLVEAGVATAWIACAIGNERAARLCQKSGWRVAGTMVVQMTTEHGAYSVEAWRFEKRLQPRAVSASANRDAGATGSGPRPEPEVAGGHQPPV